MSAHFNAVIQLPGEPSVHMNPGAGTGPFAVIEFGDETWLTFHDPADAEKWAAAFTEAAHQLREAQS